MSTSLTLYEITDTLPALLDTVDMTEPGTPERAEIEGEIQRYMEALPVKVDGVCHMLAKYEAASDASASEIKRLQTRKQAFDRARDRLEAYCVAVLERMPEPTRGHAKLEGETNTLTLRASDAAKITNESQIPEQYKTAAVELPLSIWSEAIGMLPDSVREEVMRSLTKQDVKVRLAEIKKAIKAGLEVPGADLEFRHTLQRK